MPLGIVTYFNVAKGFGHIKLDDQPEEVFVHFRDVLDEARILVPNEMVSFETTRTAKGLQARNVRRFGNRLRGQVISYKFGRGYIQCLERRATYAFHHPDVLGKGFKHIEVGYQVEFSPFQLEQENQAKEIIISDTRPALQKFAYLPEWDVQLASLAMLAAPENWDTTDDPHSYVLLDQYIHESFRIAQLHRTLAFRETIYGQECLMNTGLQTHRREHIFALFETGNATPSRRDYLPRPNWAFKSFLRESHWWLGKFPFLPMPLADRIAPHKLLFDPGVRWELDWEHLLSDRIDRFPASWQLKPLNAQLSCLQKCLAFTIEKVQENPNWAVPQWYQGHIQFLAPLYLGSSNKPNLALVLERQQTRYRGQTVLPLTWAYSNARLLGRVRAAWLTAP